MGVYCDGFWQDKRNADKPSRGNLAAAFWISSPNSSPNSIEQQQPGSTIVHSNSLLRSASSDQQLTQPRLCLRWPSTYMLHGLPDYWIPVLRVNAVDVLVAIGFELCRELVKCFVSLVFRSSVGPLADAVPLE